MVAALPPEIWARIILNLYRPPPAPNSGATRSDVTQPDLAACMRVSIEFNRCASNILYQRVITDRLDLFILGLSDKRAHLNVESKAELISRTKYLHIELTDPDLPLEGYTLSSRGVPELATQHVPPRRCQPKHAEAIIDMLRTSLTKLNDHIATSLSDNQHNASAPFKLDTLTFGAYMPVYDDTWVNGFTEAGYPSLEDSILRTVRSAAGKLLESSRSRHFCQRSLYSPLRLAQLQAYDPAYRPSKEGPPTVTVHAPYYEPLTFGCARAIAWRMESHAEHPFDWHTTVDDMSDQVSELEGLCHLVKDSMAGAYGSEEYDLVSSEPPKLSIYASDPDTRHDLGFLDSDESESCAQSVLQHDRDQAKRCQAEIEDLLEGYTALDMVFEWKAAQDAPHCHACGM